MTDRILPSWREGAARSALVAFLDRVDEIPPDDRVAVFDNDGTMWCEKPNYTQLEFLLAELGHAVAADASVGERDEYRAILDGDRQALGAIGLERVAFALVDLHTGLTPEEFNAKVAAFFAEAVHPDSRRPYRQQRYQPMLELMDELRSRGFGFYIVSAGGAEFVRVIGQDFYGVPPEGVVGSQIQYEIDRDDSGSLRLLRTNKIVDSGPNEGPGKPPNIQRILGRRPVVAGGNSAGDAEMLEFAMSYDGPSLSLLVDHDDAEREYSYESKAGTFETEETVLDTAARLNWVVVSIKDDWSTVFSDS
ncbi:MAG: haloacid dehalogenase-like hydrolase [Acidobacteria bacterium]|nr:haloacid dehalogenase-like hydrolase [Acidobacteriota bacterium]